MIIRHRLHGHGPLQLTPPLWTVPTFLLFLTEYYSDHHIISVQLSWPDLQTSSVAEKSTDAVVQEDMAVSDRFKWCPKMMPDSDHHKW